MASEALSTEAEALRDEYARKFAARAVLKMAECEPTEEQELAMDLLAGSKVESLHVIDADDLELAIAIAISDALFDGEITLLELAGKE